jgi:enoyl-CoA hydratase
VLAADGHALEEALKLSERITKNGPLAIAASKEIVINSSDWSSSEMWQRQMEYLIPVFTSKDAQEGPRAFAEKREPKWTGS